MRGARQLRDDASARRERRLEALAHDLLRLLGRAVVGDDVMAGALQPARHVGAHAAESDDDEVRVSAPARRVGARQASARVEGRARLASPASGSSRGGRAGTGRSWPRATAKSPSAWASMSTPNVSGQPGMGRSSGWLAGQLEEAARSAGRPCGAGRSSAGSAGRSRGSSRGASGRAAAPGCARSASVRRSVGAMYACSAR